MSAREGILSILLVVAVVGLFMADNTINHQARQLASCQLKVAQTWPIQEPLKGSFGEDL